MTLADGEVTRACLINGTELRCGFLPEHPTAPAGRGERGLRGQRNRARHALPVPEAYRNRVVILGNELQRTSYEIVDLSVADGRTTVSFGDTLFLVQMGPVEATNDEAGTITLGKVGRVDGGQHQGRWLYNEDRSEVCVSRRWPGARSPSRSAAAVGRNLPTPTAMGGGS